MILGLLSDAHGNREAYERGVDVLREHGADAIYFLGDAVGYLPGADVVAAVRDTTHGAVLGNHDAAVLAGTVDEGRDAIFRHRETIEGLSRDDRTTMASWPRAIEVSAPCGELLFVHGSPTDPLGGYVYPDTDLGGWTGMNKRAVFMGQTHRPFISEREDTIFVNVGSCGLPRDCGSRGSVCIFDDTRAEARILRFDIRSATMVALRRCGPVAPEVAEVLAREPAAGCFGESHD